METEFLEHYIEASRQRLEALLQRAEELPKPLGDLWQQLSESTPISEEVLLRESLQELAHALEELQVASEELQQQNEQLMASKLASEAQQYRYKTFFDLATDGYLITNPQGLILEGNPAVASMLQLANQLLVGKPLSTFIPLEQRHHFRCQLNLLQQGQELCNWEVKLQPRQGKPILAVVTVTPLCDPLEGIVIFCWQIHQVSQVVLESCQREVALKAAAETDLRDRPPSHCLSPNGMNRRSRGVPEERQERRERLWGLAFRHSTIGMALLDRSGCAIDSNQALQTMLNYSREELQQTSFLKLIHPYDRKIHRTLFGELIAGQRDRYCLDKRFLSKEGQIQRGSLAVALVRDNNSEPLCAIAFLQELAEVRDRQRGFQWSAEQLEQIFFMGNS